MASASAGAEAQFGAAAGAAAEVAGAGAIVDSCTNCWWLNQPMTLKLL